MIEWWRCNHSHVLVLLLPFLLFFNCWSLNDEGMALLRFRERIISDPFGALKNWKDDNSVMNPCSWNGVDCSDRSVVSLNLKDLCLGGTLAPEFEKLHRLKSIVLRNNSFSGTIPLEFAKLKELEVLDLGHNNITGPLPEDLGSNLSILLLDNNHYLNCISPEIFELQMLSEVQTNDKILSQTTKMSTFKKKLFPETPFLPGDVSQRKLRQISSPDIPRNVRTVYAGPSPVAPPEGSPSPAPSQHPSPSVITSFGSPLSTHTITDHIKSAKLPNSNNHHALILYLTIGGALLLAIVAIGIYFWKISKVAVVKPWATGLSGQLQKALVTGLPKLKRSELETACEEFSNVIGSSAVGTLYKGTLSSGVEIAVMSFLTESVKDWSNILEGQFRGKIETLSKLNHKNFVNLLGYCKEEEPFTRMMVFEYAPNGTLFEHLHIRESEHLDWTMRMRIIMGIAYCLDYMHQLAPPIVHKNLNSSSVYLSEDYAAKVSDFCFWREVSKADKVLSPASNIYSFGVILFEIITGKLPYSVESSMINDWAREYLRGDKPVTELADPTLSSLDVQLLERICEVIRSCTDPDPKRRPSMREVTAILREVTSIAPDRAIPRLSPLWWAELEIISGEVS